MKVLTKYYEKLQRQREERLAGKEARRAEYKLIRSQTATATMTVRLDDGTTFTTPLEARGGVLETDMGDFVYWAEKELHKAFQRWTDRISVNGYTSDGHVHYLPHRITTVTLSAVEITHA